MLRKLGVAVLALCCLVAAQDHSEQGKETVYQPPHLDRGGEKWAEKTLKKLSLEEKIGQLIMPWAKVQFLNVASPEFQVLQQYIQKYHIGSFGLTVPQDNPFLLRSQPYEAAALTNQLQHESKLPLLFAADFERGLSMRLYGTTTFPHAMAFAAAGKTQYAESFGRISAEESRAIGVHWNFFPVADVNSNPANPIINTRSFGEDAQQVSDLVAAYIKGAHSAGMLTTAKHFPGHGDTATDSHLGITQVGGDLQHLNSVELPPFRRAIETGVDSVMVANVTVPALESDPNRVANTSPAVVRNLLREQLGFKGLVVTDALDMGGLTRLYAGKLGRTCVDAFLAGNDLLLIPPDVDSCFHAMLSAAQIGEIPQTRIDESVLRILRIKASLGLHRTRDVKLEDLPYAIAKPESLAIAQTIADEAVTLVRDNGQVLPLHLAGTSAAAVPYQTVERIANRLVLIVFTDDIRLEWGRILERQVRNRVPDANVFFVDSRTASGMSPSILQAIAQAQQVIAGVFIIPSAGRRVQTGGQLTDSVALSDASGALLQNVVSTAAPKTMVVAFGSPYFVSDFQNVESYMCTFSNSTVSEIAAVRALFGEIPIHGRLPVTIPNFAARGAGLDRSATTGGSSHGHH